MSTTLIVLVSILIASIFTACLYYMGIFKTLFPSNRGLPNYDNSPAQPVNPNPKDIHTITFELNEHYFKLKKELNQVKRGLIYYDNTHPPGNGTIQNQRNQTSAIINQIESQLFAIESMLNRLSRKVTQYK